MKKILLLLIFLLIAVVPFYFIFIWNPEEGINSRSADDISMEASKSLDYSINTEKNVDKELSEDNGAEITVLSKISEEDKVNIEKIINKLPIVDILKINDYMTKENIDKGISNILKHAKKRLRQYEFEKIEIIFNKYKKHAEI